MAAVLLLASTNCVEEASGFLDAMVLCNGEVRPFDTCKGLTSWPWSSEAHFWKPVTATTGSSNISPNMLIALQAPS